MNKDETISRLHLAVMDFVKAHGGRAAVAYGAEVQKWPEDKENVFVVAVRVIGEKPLDT